MIEKNLQSLFSSHVREHREAFEGTHVFELKLEKGNRFAYARLAPHQRKALTDAKHLGMYHKISDTASRAAGEQGFSRFVAQKPFDCMLIKGAQAYLALCFYHPRRKKELHLIDIDAFLFHEGNATHKSMTEAEAASIATRTIRL